MLQYQDYWAVVRRTEKGGKASKQRQTALLGEARCARRGCFSSCHQHILGGPQPSARGGGQAELPAMGFAFSDTSCHSPFFFPWYQGGREDSGVAGRCTAQPSHPQEQLPGAAGTSGGGATIFPLQGSLWAVVFVNWETFPLWTGNSEFCFGDFFFLLRAQRGCSFSTRRNSSDRRA